MILTEDKAVLPIVEIDEDTKGVLSIFQDMLTLLNKYFHEGSKLDKRGHISSLKDFKLFKQELSRYHNYPFIQTVIKQVDNINSEMINLIQAKRENKNLSYQSLVPDIKRAKEAWLSGDRKTVIAASKLLVKKMDASSIARNSETEVMKGFHNPMYIENPLIFQTTNFLETFEQNAINEVIHKDLNVYKYSYLKLPHSRFSDFQYIAYFILQLQDKPGTQELSGKQLSKYYKMAYSDDAYAELLKDMRSYLSSNNKSLLPKIIEELKKYPDIIKGNRAALKGITTVYRGISFNYDDENGNSEPDINEVIEKEKAKAFTATSPDKRVARRFALSIGHLEPLRAARTNGYVLEFTVDENSTILDTDIFGGIFGENEIIINPKKADITNYEYLDAESFNYDDDYDDYDDYDDDDDNY